MNTTPTHPDVTKDGETNEQLLARIQMHATALAMHPNEFTHATLKKTIAAWARKYGTTDRLEELENVCAKVGTIFESGAVIGKQAVVHELLNKAIVSGFMQAIEQLKKGDETSVSAAAPAIQNETTQTLGSVFAEGYPENLSPTQKTPSLLEG